MIKKGKTVHWSEENGKGDRQITFFVTFTFNATRPPILLYDKVMSE